MTEATKQAAEAVAETVAKETVEEVRLGPHTVQLRPANGGKYPQANPLLVRGAERTAMIDACLHTSPAEADLLLISHYHEDHTVDAGSCAEVWVHSADAAGVRHQDVFLAAMGIPAEAAAGVLEEFRWAPVPHARAFEDGQVFDLGGGVTITALHLPGHTPGHAGFLVQPDGVAFIGDVDLSSFGPLYSDEDSRLADFRATIEACAGLEATVYATAHHKGPYWDRDEYLQVLADFGRVLETREEAILDLLREGVRTAEEMVGRGVVYRPGRRPAFADRVEESMCAKHLEDLVARGLVAVDQNGAHTLV